MAVELNTEDVQAIELEDALYLSSSSIFTPLAEPASKHRGL